jgi:hypothetical protein
MELDIFFESGQYKVIYIYTWSHLYILKRTYIILHHKLKSQQIRSSE